MQPKQWIDVFLNTRQLRYDALCSSAIPLYQYALTDDEFLSLKKTLRTSMFLGIQEVFSAIKHWDALFVLYTAEWWRREHDGSAWAWEPVFASFKGDVSELSVNQRNMLVERGLSYWHRPLRKVNGSRRYFGTLAVEGGLPLRQLSNLDSQGGWLGRVFKSAIPKYIRLRSSGVMATEVVSEYAGYCPKTFRNDQIYSILGDMLETVVALKIDYKLAEQQAPIEYLDKVVSDWRTRFPLPVDDAVSVHLLSDMISMAAKAEEGGVPFSVTRCLNAHFSLELHLECKRFVPLNLIFSGQDDALIPFKLSVELVCEDNTRIALGYALKTQYKNNACLKMPSLDTRIAGAKASLSYVLNFKYLSEVIKTIPLIGAEHLNNDVPWVFRCRDEQWILEGTASVSTRANSVRVMYPHHLSSESNDELTLLTELEHKKIIETTESFRLQDKADGSFFVIQTAQSRSAESYYLQGQELSYVSEPTALYLGLPVVRCYQHETTQTNIIPATTLVARPVSSTGSWQSLQSVGQGIYDVRLLGQDGRIKFRKKCALLADDFLIRLKPLKNTVSGLIVLEHIGDAEVICDPAIRHTINVCDDGVEIECFTDERQLSSVALSLRWSGQIEMLNLRVPFPIKGGALIDADDVRSSQSILYLDNLYGFRVRLFSERPKYKKELTIELKLIDTLLSDVKDIYFRERVKRDGAVVDLSMINYLEWTQSLLSCSSNLDSYVKFSVYESGAEMFSVAIHQYQTTLERNIVEGCVDLSFSDHARCSYTDLSGIRLKAMRLSHPEEQQGLLDEKLSENTGVGSWYFYPETRVPEPWLIYSCPDSSVSLRPLLWMGTQEIKVNEINPLTVSTLHTAVMIESFTVRQWVLKKILLKMAFDFSHSGWDYLKDLAGITMHLPLSSFDIWSAVVSDHKILVALVLQMDQTFIEKVTAELPVLWELIALAEWLSVLDVYRLYLSTSLDDNALVINLLNSRLEHLTYLPQSMDIVLLLLRLRVTGKNCPELLFLQHENVEGIVIEQIKEIRRDMDRQQADSEWLRYLDNEIEGYWLNMPDIAKVLLNVEGTPKYHLAVLRLPILLAHFCLQTSPVHWSADRLHIFKLKQLKAFDDVWFKTVFDLALGYLAQLAVNEQGVQEKVAIIKARFELDIQVIDNELYVLEDKNNV